MTTTPDHIFAGSVPLAAKDLPRPLWRLYHENEHAVKSWHEGARAKSLVNRANGLGLLIWEDDAVLAWAVVEFDPDTETWERRSYHETEGTTLSVDHPLYDAAMMVLADGRSI